MKKRMVRNTTLGVSLAAVLIAVASGCGGDATGESSFTTAKPSDSQPELPIDTGTTEGKLYDESSWVWNVDGVEVVTQLLGEELPEQANIVQVDGYVIAAPSESPVLCSGGVLESYPPQCSGIQLFGLDISLLPEEANEVRFGGIGVRLELDESRRTATVIDVVPVGDTWTYQPRTPEQCVALQHNDSDPEILGRYAAELGDSVAGGIFVGESGIWVLDVVSEVELHRQELVDRGVAEPCVISTGVSRRDLANVQAAIQGERSASSVGTGAYGRVDVVVPFADRETAHTFASLVSRPELIRLIGEAKI